MQFKIFTIPVTDDGSALDEMNSFLRSHKVLEAEQQLVSTKNGSQWHFCIKYLANAQPEEKNPSMSKIDYKDVLDEKTFSIFSALREIRKKIAEEEGMPVYAIFTNEELASIAWCISICRIILYRHCEERSNLVRTVRIASFLPMTKSPSFTPV